MENHLIINKDFYDRLQKDEKYIEILNLYGYENAKDFMNKIIKRINDEYSNDFYINDFTTTDEKKYGIFNGYVSGNFSFYEEIIVSFHTFEIGSRDTIINQNLLPLVKSKVLENPFFLINEKIKKIYLLTAFNNTKRPYNKDKNKVNATLQKMVNCLNTINFDVISIFPIDGLLTHNKYSNLAEFDNHISSISTTNENSPITINGNNIIFDIKDGHQGNDYKYYAMHYYTALMLNNNYNYDMSKVIEKAGQTDQILAVKKFLDFINESQLVLSNDDFIEDNYYIESSEKLDDSVFDVTRKPEIFPTKNGKKYKTYKDVKDKKINKVDFLCDCHDDRHDYFISSRTNRNYIEGHHIIPMKNQESYWEKFKKNLDVVQNISPLCPKCHRQVHNGTAEEKLVILRKIFEKNSQSLKELDSSLTIENLMEYYNIFRM